MDNCKIFGTIGLSMSSVVFFAACSMSPYALSDRAARDIVISSFAREQPIPFALGSLSVISSMQEQVQGVGGEGSNKISQEAFGRYQQLQQNGLITITNVRDLTSKFQGWNTWLERV